MTPKTKHKYVGIEMEFSCPYPIHYMKAKLKEKGLNKYVEIDYDGRANANEESYEWRILCRETQVATIVFDVCKLIYEMGGRCNNSHGLHVHLDMRHRDKEESFKALVLAQPMLFKIAHKRRDTSHYCQKVDASNLYQYDQGHYGAINPRTPYDTIEVRIREGITNHHDIIKYVESLVAIVDSKVQETVSDVSDLEKVITLKESVKEYLASKLKRRAA